MADPSETTQVSGSLGDLQGAEAVEALRSLTAQVAELQQELQALRAEARGLPLPEARAGWAAGAGVSRDGSAWVRSLDAPTARRLRVPWLGLEIAFLVTVAALSVVAGLDAAVVAAVMLVAWALVALAEWLLARAARVEHELVYGAGPVGARLPEDPSWFAPPLGETAFDPAELAERTAARLPPPADEA